MKKSLLAVAAIGAFASAAQAQSSVTVYGIMDVGYIGGDYRGTSISASTSAPVSQSGAVTQKEHFSVLGQSAESTSRLGFRGNEDLGGGTSAVFTIEVGIQPNNASSTTINRQTFAGLKKNGIGQATIGTQYTPIHVLAGQTDAAGLNNLVGNAVYATSPQSSSGAINNGVAPYAGPVASQSFNGTTGAYTTRVSNALVFQSNRMAGVQLNAIYGQNNLNQTETGVAYSATGGGVNNSVVMGVGADWTWNKLVVGAAYQQLKNQAINTATTLTTGSSATAGGTAGSFGTNMIDNQTYAAATYDFGIVKAYLQYVDRKATSVMDSSFYTSRSAQQIGVKGNITPTISAFATAGMGKSRYWGQGVAPTNFTTVQLGADYFLSKRTNLYALYGSVNQATNGTNGTGNPSSGTTAGEYAVGATNYALGIRHTF